MSQDKTSNLKLSKERKTLLVVYLIEHDLKKDVWKTSLKIDHFQVLSFQRFVSLTFCPFDILAFDVLSCDVLSFDILFRAKLLDAQIKTLISTPNVTKVNYHMLFFFSYKMPMFGSVSQLAAISGISEVYPEKYLQGSVKEFKKKIL